LDSPVRRVKSSVRRVKTSVRRVDIPGWGMEVNKCKVLIGEFRQTRVWVYKRDGRSGRGLLSRLVKQESWFYFGQGVYFGNVWLLIMWF